MKIMLHCTDKNVNVEAYILNHKKDIFLEVAVNTVKIRMNYIKNTKAYVGNMAGLEFVVRENDVPSERRKEWSR